MALLHELPFLDRHLDDLARDFRRDLHLDLGLDLARGGDDLGDVGAERLIGRDEDRLLALARDHLRGDRGDDQQRKDAEDDDFLPGTLRPLTHEYRLPETL